MDESLLSNNKEDGYNFQIRFSHFQKDRRFLNTLFKKEAITPDEQTNKISTSKYNWFNFIPKILFEQFQKPANIYFLLIAILQSINFISISNGKPVILIPLTTVLILSGLKDFFEDYKRELSDKEENFKNVNILIETNKRKSYKTIPWKELKVGNIVRIKKDEQFPADLLLLQAYYSCNGIKTVNNKCFIETKNLDGETNLKVK